MFVALQKPHVSFSCLAERSVTAPPKTLSHSVRLPVQGQIWRSLIFRAIIRVGSGSCTSGLNELSANQIHALYCVLSIPCVHLVATWHCSDLVFPLYLIHLTVSCGIYCTLFNVVQNWIHAYICAMCYEVVCPRSNPLSHLRFVYLYFNRREKQPLVSHFSPVSETLLHFPISHFRLGDGEVFPFSSLVFN